MSPTPPLTREHSPSSKQRREQFRSLGFAQQACADWQKLQNHKSGSLCTLDGFSLDIADVVAVAKYGSQSFLSTDPQIRERIERSIETLHKHLNAGHLIYGVTTGFGGSADTRTTDTVNLQRSLIQHLNSGVLTSKDIGHQEDPTRSTEFDSDFDTQSMPSSWVRASMLIRCNSIIRGHSGVRTEIAEKILALLRHEITPVVPLRGSVSASGDLSPLSYIAGAIEGSPDIYVRVGKGTNTIMTAQQALEKVGMTPVVLHAKEGLGLLNGTAVSAAVASLALHQTQEIALLTQVMTAMATEALQGTAESFFPRIAEMRPHPGQVESAATILALLSHSKLAQCVEGPKDTKVTGLYQDRYALRTSSQWIAPQLEDLHHAREQLLIEINSTTDNPLIDCENDQILHGGNFQAAVVTSTMDRSRLAIEKFGRMLFAQGTEMINPSTNKGLPANLASDDPSLSFTCKGIDTNMASYASELGFLANPVGNHVMSAEMHNQAINSIALISARYTIQALDVIRILCAAHLFVVCQALDLRVQQVRFTEQALVEISKLLQVHFPNHTAEQEPEFFDSLKAKFLETYPTTMNYDHAERFSRTVDSLIPVLVQKFENPADFCRIKIFTSQASTILAQRYKTVQTDLQNDRLNIVPSYLGFGSRALYTLIRSPAPEGLGVPFHRGLVEHPSMPKPDSWTAEEANQRRTIGSRLSAIYEGIRDGKVGNVIMNTTKECLTRG